MMEYTVLVDRPNLQLTCSLSISKGQPLNIAQVKRYKQKSLGEIKKRFVRRTDAVSSSLWPFGPLPYFFFWECGREAVGTVVILQPVATCMRLKPTHRGQIGRKIESSLHWHCCTIPDDSAPSLMTHIWVFRYVRKISFLLFKLLLIGCSGFFQPNPLLTDSPGLKRK